MKLWQNVVTTLAVIITIIPSLRDQAAEGRKQALKDSKNEKQDTIVIERVSAEADVRPCQGSGTGSLGARGNE